MKLVDLTNQTFGRWTVLQRAANHDATTMWICRCTCGRVKDVASQKLRNGSSPGCASCGHKLPEDVLADMKRRRSDGQGIRAIAKALNISHTTVSRNVGPTGERTNWMRRYYRRALRLYWRGLSWAAMLVTLGRPYRTAKSFREAFEREHIRRHGQRYYVVLATRELTQRGMNAQTIAERLECSERHVVRLRSRPIDDFTDAQRAIKLRLRGVAWADIAERIGVERFDLQAKAEAWDRVHSDFLLENL